jgi:hypothetical protein
MLQEKVCNLEMALQQLENESHQRIEDVVNETETLMTTAKKDIEKAAADMITANAQINITMQLKAQVCLISLIDKSVL